MKPWSSRLRPGAGLPYAFLTLSMAAVVSCVSVAGRADVPGQVSPTASAAASLPATATGASTAALLAPTGTAAAPTAAPRAPSPTPAPSLTPGPTLPATPEPSASPEVSAVVAVASGSTLDKATRRKLEAILTNLVRKKGIAGVQAAVRLPSGETWLGSAGDAEFAPPRPIEDDTAFSIASVTKTFIAALIMQLAEEGKLGLDEPFGTYFSDAPRSNSVTIRQLLSHTSGIYDYFQNPRYIEASRAWLRASPTGLNSRQHRWTYDEIMSLVKSGYCKPGECYHYSNTNFVILGKVAEAVAGEPLHEQLRQRFFDPLGMDHTVFQPDELPPPDAAHGYWRRVGGGYSDHTRDAQTVPFMAAVSVADAAGAIASTAEDLSIWADALYGGKILSRKSLSQMTHMFSPGSYGLGTDVASFAGHRGYGHRGGLRGFESSMWYFPDAGVSVVLLSNQGNWFTNARVRSTDVPVEKLVRAVLGKA